MTGTTSGSSYLGIANRSAGLVAMLAAAALIAAGSWPGLVRKLLIGAGTFAIGLVLAALVVRSRCKAMDGCGDHCGRGLAAVLALPAVVLSRRAQSPSNGNDAALWAIPPRRGRPGDAPVGDERRCLAELRDPGHRLRLRAGRPRPGTGRRSRYRRRWQSLPAALAALAMLASSLHGLKETAQRATRRVRPWLERIYEHLEQPRSSYFFTDHPGFNRLNGRLELVYDDWLYPVFESLGLAEPRSPWLGPALAGTGPGCRLHEHPPVDRGDDDRPPPSRLPSRCPRGACLRVGPLSRLRRRCRSGPAPIPV